MPARRRERPQEGGRSVSTTARVVDQERNAMRDGASARARADMYCKLAVDDWHALGEVGSVRELRRDPD